MTTTIPRQPVDRLQAAANEIDVAASAVQEGLANVTRLDRPRTFRQEPEQSQLKGRDMSANGQSPESTTDRTNPLATAALVCGLVQFLVPPAFVASIILGHIARRQIRITGERGKGIATAGMILGYHFLAWLTVLVLALLVFANARFA